MTGYVRTERRQAPGSLLSFWLGNQMALVRGENDDDVGMQMWRSLGCLWTAQWQGLGGSWYIVTCGWELREKCGLGTISEGNVEVWMLMKAPTSHFFI